MWEVNKLDLEMDISGKIDGAASSTKLSTTTTKQALL